MNLWWVKLRMIRMGKQTEVNHFEGSKDSKAIQST